jgi:hypothetical protein
LGSAPNGYENSTTGEAVSDNTAVVLIGASSLAKRRIGNPGDGCRAKEDKASGG